MAKDRSPTPRGESRRKFLVRAMQAVGISIVGGVVWGAFVKENTYDPLVLRPPGALPGDEFLKKCIKCGLCVEACANRPSVPYKDGKKMVTLRLAAPGDNKPLGTPYFIPREVPCYMCENIPCVPVCPTGALEPDLVSTLKDGKKELDITKARMGVAVIDQKNCIAYWGLRCDACYRVCPILDKAIYIEIYRNPRTGKHAYLVPKIDPDYCTGCGLCEHACVTEKPAVFVLPREVALGKAGEHYLKGWEEETSVEETPKGTRGLGRGSAEDYLNTEDLLNE